MKEAIFDFLWQFDHRWVFTGILLMAWSIFLAGGQPPKRRAP